MDEPSSIPPDEPPDEAEPPKKRSGGRILLLLAVVALAVGAFAAGSVFGPTVVSKLHWPHRATVAENPDKDEGPAGSTAVLDPIIIDLREASGEIHHLKLGIGIELMTSMHGEEFKRYDPRVRDATISYLRTLTFEEVTNASQLERIRSTLRERIGTAIGRSAVRRVLFTDFVAQ